MLAAGPWTPYMEAGHIQARNIPKNAQGLWHPALYLFRECSPVLLVLLRRVGISPYFFSPQ